MKIEVGDRVQIQPAGIAKLNTHNIYIPNFKGGYGYVVKIRNRSTTAIIVPLSLEDGVLRKPQITLEPTVETTKEAIEIDIEYLTKVHEKQTLTYPELNEITFEAPSIYSRVDDEDYSLVYSKTSASLYDSDGYEIKTFEPNVTKDDAILYIKSFRDGYRKGIAAGRHELQREIKHLLGIPPEVPLPGGLKE